MLELKAVFGTIAVIIALITYIPYIRDVFKGKTKPHVFTWFIWGAISVIIFFSQFLYGGGAGSWVTGLTGVLCLVIFVLALKRGEKSITKSDWVSFIGAIISVVLWYVTSSPLYSVILLTIIDAFGFYPTFRKSVHKPQEETLSTYSWSVLKSVVALAALESYSVITYLYPLSLVIMNGALVLLLIVYRRKFRKRNTQMPIPH